jgi:hypothetical protein
MSSWKEYKQSIQNEMESKRKYMNSEIKNDIKELKRLITRYIENGGQSQTDDTNPDYLKIVALSNKIKKAKDDFFKINDDVAGKIKELATSQDIGKLLSENGIIQQDIQQLEKKKKETDIDAETAKERADLLRSSKSEVSSHQLFMTTRPIKKALIPVLWTLSFLFVIIGIIIFRRFMPELAASSVAPSVPTAMGTTTGIFQDPRVWMSLTGASIIVIIILILKTTGVIGQKK